MTTPDAAARARELVIEARAKHLVLGEPYVLTNEQLADLIATALQEAFELGELSAVEKLNQPGAMRVNVLRGTIKLPDDLVWLHDTNGPAAEACAQARDATLREAAAWCEERAQQEREYASGWWPAQDVHREHTKRAEAFDQTASHLTSMIGAKP